MGGGELLKQHNHGLIIQPVPRKRLGGGACLFVWGKAETGVQ